MKLRSSVRVLLVALVDDEVDRLGRILDPNEPVGRRSRRSGRAASAPSSRCLGRIDGVAPEVEAPAGVDAVGAVVVQLDVALRGSPGGVHGRVAGLQPDLRRLLRVEEAVGAAVRILRVALVDDEADLRGVRGELHPGEAAVLVLAGERLRRRPGHVRLVHVAPDVDAPVVVDRVGPLVVDDGVVAGRARPRPLHLADDGRRRVGVEVAGPVAHDRLDLQRRARGEPGDVVEDPVGRVVVGAEDGPLGGVAGLDREGDLGELRPVEDGLDLDVADDLGALGGLGQRHDRVARARRQSRGRAVDDGRERRHGQRQPSGGVGRRRRAAAEDRREAHPARVRLHLHRLRRLGVVERDDVLHLLVVQDPRERVDARRRWPRSGGSARLRAARGGRPAARRGRRAPGRADASGRSWSRPWSRPSRSGRRRCTSRPGSGTCPAARPCRRRRR